MLTSFVKNCDPNLPCKIKDSDIEVNSASFISNKEMKPYKEIHYNLYCASEQPSALPPNTLYSKTCAMNIITQGGAAVQSGMIKYELSVEDEMDTHMLHLNHHSFIRLHPNQKKVYTLSFQHPTPKANGLTFSIDGKYGNVTACLRINKMDGDCWQSALVKADGHGFEDAFKRLILNYTTHAGNIGGDYNLELKAEEMGAGLILGTSEIFTASDSPLIAREIKAGLPLSDHLVNSSQVAYYTFELTKLDSADEIDLLVINLTPISGRYTIVVRNDDTPPSQSNAQWFSTSNEIIIKKSDEFFKSTGRYMIAVIPIETYTGHESFKYQIKWSYLDKHDVLAPGIINYGTIPEVKKCFVAEILPTHRSVLITKGGSEGTDVYISLGNENHLPLGTNNDFMIDLEQSGVQILKEQIDEKCKIVFELKKYCNAYICLYGNTGAEYSLSFSTDNNPITLIEGKVFEGPVPIKDQSLRFIYHPQKYKALDIEEFSVKQTCTISADIEEFNTTKGYVWPDKSTGTNTGGASIIHVPREQLENYTNPVILITMSKSEKFDVPNEKGNFIFDAKFGLEAGGELRELVEHKQRIGIMPTSMWNYFYFYNYDPNEVIVIGLDSLDGGDADMFVGRGKDIRPTEFNHLARSTGYRSSYIEVTPDMVQGKGFKDLTGYYVVGIKANSDLRYSIHWKHTKNAIVKSSFGEIHSVIIQPASSAHLLLYNLIKGNVMLILNTHHQPLDVYWHSFQRANASIAEEFPTTSVYQMKFPIEEINPIALIQIDETAMGACVLCKYLYTLQNPNPTEPIKVDFYFDLSHEQGGKNQLPPQVIQPSIRMFGALAASQTKHYHLNIPTSNSEQIKNYYLDFQLLHGEGEVVAKVKDTMGSDHTLFSDKVVTGFTKVSLKQLVDNNQMNGGAGFNGISLSNVLIDLTCTAACTYRMVLVRPEHFTELSMNEAKENLIEHDEQEQSFVYKATGKEHKFELNFVIKHFTDETLHSLTNSEIKSIVTVWHVKDKEELKKSESQTSLKILHTEVDGLNGKLHLSYPVVEGYYLVVIKSLKKTGFVYRLEANTHFISTLLSGRQSVELVTENSTHHIFEFYPHQPGTIYAKIERCFGDVSLSVKEIGAHNYFEPVEIENDKFTSVIESNGFGRPIYLKASKSVNRKTVHNEFGYLDHSKNLSVFSVEMYESRAWNRISFEDIKPFNEDVYIDLKSSPPEIMFRPIWLKEKVATNFQVRYYVAVSKDPEALDFYAGCDKTMMSRVLKEGFSIDDAVQVFNLPLNPALHMELGPMKPYHKLSLPLSSGHRYFALVFAQVSIVRPSDATTVGVADSVRVKYAHIEFEYRSFFYPIELLAATIGLIGLVIASFCVLNGKLAAIIRKKLKFKQISENDVDSDLEDYFMRIKYDYDQISSGQRTANESMDVLDTSTMEGTHADHSTIENLEPSVLSHADESRIEGEAKKQEVKEDKSVELV